MKICRIKDLCVCVCVLPCKCRRARVAWSKQDNEFPPFQGHTSRDPHDMAKDSSTSKNLDRRSVLLEVAIASIAVVVDSACFSIPSARAESVIDGQGTTEVLPLSAEEDLSVPQRQVLEYNRRSQRQNGVPPDFPLFVREGYNMTVLVSDGYEVSPEGIIYKDYVVGAGDSLPQDGQQVQFDYTAYNEAASVIDSSYRKGQPASTRLGIQGLIPGFEIGLRTMKPGGKRRIIVPPELGPPVGPSTFFSAKQYEVFDVELRSAKNCVRRSVGMFSDVVCE